MHVPIIYTVTVRTAEGCGGLYVYGLHAAYTVAPRMLRVDDWEAEGGAAVGLRAVPGMESQVHLTTNTRSSGDHLAFHSSTEVRASGALIESIDAGAVCRVQRR